MARQRKVHSYYLKPTGQTRQAVGHGSRNSDNAGSKTNTAFGAAGNLHKSARKFPRKDR